MTSKQVRDNFVQNLAENAYLNMCTVEEMEIAISALEKQIPKKPIKLKTEQDIKIGAGTWKSGTTVYKCPRCDSFISRSSNYCDKCGKALDWRENDER